MSMNW